MKVLIVRMGLAVVIALCFVNISLAENCKDANTTIDWAVAKPPAAMTEEYIQMALKQCPDNPDLYHRIANYYKHWYKTELNPEKQATYRIRAIEYYREGIKFSKGQTSKAMKSELADLQRSSEFSKAAFRALRPVQAGSTGLGLAMKIKFEFDSANLSEGAQDHLDLLGEVLIEQETIRISLEGHTDQTGAESYNKQLSIQRAEVVKNYLVKSFSIAPNRILTAGYGYERLVDLHDPFSSENRRVEVIKLSE
jgi:outer membrane protein OmpA-like peptidoglycan-associated protein